MNRSPIDVIIQLVADIDDLKLAERTAIMRAAEGDDQQSEVDRLIRQIITWAVVTRSTDIHISGRNGHDEPDIYVSIRTQSGLQNYVFPYAGTRVGKMWQHKLFQLTGTSVGASTPEILSTRFRTVLPAHYAEKKGLKPLKDSNIYPVDIRVQYTKTFDGFTFKLRLLDGQRSPELKDMGLSKSRLKCILRALAEPSGLILVTGPTGSGKSTFLNACMRILNDGSRSIWTIEDPVEMTLNGDGPISQTLVHGNITWERSLRSALRSDPDVIMCGEIRDMEVMDIALQAAQTGHLVLATLHANNAPETYTRALDLTKDKQRDAYRLAETLKLVVAQRLLDRYDGEMVSRPITRDEREWLKLNGVPGVEHVIENTGNQVIGKAVLLEAIVTTPEIKHLLRADRINVKDIYQEASMQLQYESLAAAGVRAVQATGCRLQDCLSRLESNSDAQAHPGLRLELAKRFGVNLDMVDRIIDDYIDIPDEHFTGSLDDFFKQEIQANEDLQQADDDVEFTR